MTATFWIIVIIVNVLWIFLCYSMAKKNGRNKELAILLGLLFGVFAVIGYVIAGKTIESKLKEIEQITEAQERAKKRVNEGK